MIENNVATVVAGTVYNQETSPSVDYKYGPYNSIQEALSILGPTDLNCICAALRFGVKQSNGTVKTYEFKTGVANESDLICITDELANKGITRVELECDDDTTIKIKGTTSSLTYDQVKALVDDRTKFVTLRYLDIWWMLPSYDDGGAIMFTSTDITNGHAEVTRVVMNIDSQMSNYIIITEDSDHKTDDLTKETALDGHQTYPTTHAVNQAINGIKETINVVEDGLFIVDVNNNIGRALDRTDELQGFLDNVSVQEYYDEQSKTAYFLTRINKVKYDGTLNLPHIHYQRKNEWCTAQELVNNHPEYKLAINASFWGTLIIDGEIITDAEHDRNQWNGETSINNYFPMVIDKDGWLHYVQPNCSAEDLVANGIVQCVCGFCPIVVDYHATTSEVFPSTVSHIATPTPAQRQIFGQFANGDYCIITCEGRKYATSDVNSVGFTIPDAQRVCIKHGLKFAYNLDGGGSTETVIGKRQVNHVYENETGRAISEFITFR